MNSIRIVRATSRVFPSAARLQLQRRGYADAVSDKIQLTLALPHQVKIALNPPVFVQFSFRTSLTDSDSAYSLYINPQMCTLSPIALSISPRLFSANYAATSRVQVNIPAESGEMGVLANHVPSIEQLKPGLVEIIEESGGSKQFFCTFVS